MKTQVDPRRFKKIQDNKRSHKPQNHPQALKMEEFPASDSSLQADFKPNPIKGQSSSFLTFPGK
jgi:hypothetical protein